MSELREAARKALTAYEMFRDVDDIDGLDDAIDRLRAALAQPKTELRDQHKAFAEWFLQQNPIAPNVEDRAWAAWKAALAQSEADAGVSWGGHNVRGDADSIAEVRRLIDFEQARQGANPPRDEWRPASEPPDSDRDVQAWIKTDLSELDEVVTEQCEAQAFYEDGVWHARGPGHDGWMQLCPGHMVSIVVWRDVTPPTEGAR